MIPKQLPHVQIGVQQPIGPRLETRQTPSYVEPIILPPPKLSDLRKD